MGIFFAAVFLGLCAALAHPTPTDAKVVRGTVSSRKAWDESGQFVTKFCFHGEATMHGRLLGYAYALIINRESCQRSEFWGHEVL